MPFTTDEFRVAFEHANGPVVTRCLAVLKLYANWNDENQNSHNLVVSASTLFGGRKPTHMATIREIIKAAEINPPSTALMLVRWVIDAIKRSGYPLNVEGDLHRALHVIALTELEPNATMRRGVVNGTLAMLEAFADGEVEFYNMICELPLSNHSKYSKPILTPLQNVVHNFVIQMNSNPNKNSFDVNRLFSALEAMIDNTNAGLQARGEKIMLRSGREEIATNEVLIRIRAAGTIQGADEFKRDLASRRAPSRAE